MNEFEFLKHRLIRTNSIYNIILPLSYTSGTQKITAHNHNNITRGLNGFKCDNSRKNIKTLISSVTRRNEVTSHEGAPLRCCHSTNYVYPKTNVKSSLNYLFFKQNLNTQKYTKYFYLKIIVFVSCVY